MIKDLFKITFGIAYIFALVIFLLLIAVTVVRAVTNQLIPLEQMCEMKEETRV